MSSHINMLLKIGSKFSLLSHSVTDINFLQRARNEVSMKMTGI